MIRQKLKIASILGLVSLPLIGLADVNTTLLDAFPASNYTPDKKPKSHITTQYYKSPSKWGADIHEENVFLAELKHTQGKDKSYAMRIGQGGQLYSLRAAFGESVPPSSKETPWNDEVWQFVAVCQKYNMSKKRVPEQVKKQLDSLNYASIYFIHNSGAYIRNAKEGRTHLYCPRFAYDQSEDGTTIRTLNWGLVPQLRTISRSPILYYFQGRNLGDGVIELTWMVHNFSARKDIVFDYLNAPWGGTRITSLPEHSVSRNDGTLINRQDVENMKSIVMQVEKTGGWNISSQTTDDNSPSLALVYGRDINLEREKQLKKEGKPYCQFAPTIYREWDASNWGYPYQLQDWKERPENSWRNYDVIEIIPKFLLEPQRTIWYRSFLVVGKRKDAIEKAKSLVDKVDYGLREFDAATTPKFSIAVTQNDAQVGDDNTKGDFKLFAYPVEGTMPLFLIENTTTKKKVITTDPYVFVEQHKLNLDVPDDAPNKEYWQEAVGYSIDNNNSDWQKLLGYAYIEKPKSGNFVRLSSVAKGLSPEQNEHSLDVWVEK